MKSEVHLHNHRNEFCPLLITVRGLKFYPACMLQISLPWSPGYWQMTQDSWVRNKGLYYSWHSKQFEHHVYVSSPCLPNPLKSPSWRMAQVDAAHTVSWPYSWGTLSLRNPSVFKGVASKSAHSLAQRLTLSSLSWTGNKSERCPKRVTISGRCAEA